MLSLKKHITQLKNPFQTSNHQLALTVVSADDDELTQAIDQQYASSDYHWQLETTPDTDKLERFWNRVEDDLQHDPNWIDFSKDGD